MKDVEVALKMHLFAAAVESCHGISSFPGYPSVLN